MKMWAHFSAIVGLLVCGVGGARGTEKNPDVTFHVAPAPLSKEAVTTEWPCVLGPSHNETSAETHILGKFSPSGPKVVWEMKKGEGYAAPVIADGRLVVFHR